MSDLRTFVLAGILLNLTPGQDSIYIVSRALAGGTRDGVLSALGVGSGTVVHTLAAGLGLSALLASSATAFAFLRWAGALYLIYLGVRMLSSREDHLAKADELSAHSSSVAVYRQGVLTNVLNPKVALFFLAFLPQFVDSSAQGRVLPFLALGAIFITTGTSWCLILALVAGRGSTALRGSARAARWMNRVGGATLVALGLRLALTGRR